MPAPMSAKKLREWVYREIDEGGFQRVNGSDASVSVSKTAIRSMHAKQRLSLLQARQDFINAWEDDLLGWFAEGWEVDPRSIDPQVVQVNTEEQAALFTYASLHWSVPVSQGFGRRTRFLVLDRSNNRLMGLFALGDPVFNLTARDSQIGWSASQRSERLYNVLDAFVLGAVSPYRELIGGKLIAMVALSDATLRCITKKYEGRVTGIQKKIKKPTPVLITTTSSLGRSSIYNRLKYNGSLLYQPVGWTQGYGHFQFSAELFDELVRHLDRKGLSEGNRFGDGPNWRIRSLRVALTSIGLDPDLIRHGVRREVFLAPVAKNWKQYLLGETDRSMWNHYSLEDMAFYYRERWAIPRSKRDPNFMKLRHWSMKLSTKRAMQVASQASG